MKTKLVRIFLVVGLLVMSLLVGSSIVSADDEDSNIATLDGWKVVFVHVVNHEESTEQGLVRTSNWTYEVRPDPENPPAYDLSNWVLALCAGRLVQNASPEPWSVGVDPHSSLYGIKWDVAVFKDEGAGQVFTFTLEGWWTTGLVNVAMKAGQEKASGQINGPSCIPTAVTFSGFGAASSNPASEANPLGALLMTATLLVVLVVGGYFAIRRMRRM